MYFVVLFLKVQVFGNNKQNEQSEEGGGILLGTMSSQFYRVQSDWRRKRSCRGTFYHREFKRGATTVRWPFLALAISSSDPDIKSIMPSLPCPTVNFMLPWLMLTLLTLSACMAVFVSVSITWSLWSTTSPWEERNNGLWSWLYSVSIPKWLCCH